MTHSQEFLLYPLDTGKDPVCPRCGTVMSLAAAEVHNDRANILRDFSSRKSSPAALLIAALGRSLNAASLTALSLCTVSRVQRQRRDQAATRSHGRRRKATIAG
jgi:hypothetical protein